MSRDTRPCVAIIGAGPAGLTAAYCLAKEGARVVVLESDPHHVGGIARTMEHHGVRFDIGCHRFFSKSREIEALWDEILPGDMLTCPRSTRILYRGRYFSYPLQPFEALRKLGLLESVRCVLSYARARLFPVADPANFEQWVSNQFGERLFRIFFKTYTEKVWGMDCREISADWAAQRIKGLSLFRAVLHALLPKSRAGNIKSLIGSFRYPRLGAGMMWQACAKKIKEMGGSILMGRRVAGCRYDESVKLWKIEHVNACGEGVETEATDVVSSAPVRSLVSMLAPAVPAPAREAAKSLRYRDFLTVILICRHRPAFDDNWLYIHEPRVEVGRIQNFRAWSADMIPDSTLTSYGLEYFCFESDPLWTSDDGALIRMASREMQMLGLAKVGDVVDGCVVRQPKAYPIYDDHYDRHIDTIRAELDERFPTLHLVGRNGMHRYNNQDHSMMTAVLTAKNILSGRKTHDAWSVNEDAEYHEAVISRQV